jgi:hypothetical protein
MHTFTQSLFATVSLCLVGSGTGFAAAPAALLNKSITVTWSESRGMKDVDNRASHRVIHRTMGIYVSGAGRMFTQTSAAAVVRNSRWVAQFGLQSRAWGLDQDVQCAGRSRA